MAQPQWRDFLSRKRGAGQDAVTLELVVIETLGKPGKFWPFPSFHPLTAGESPSQVCMAVTLIPNIWGRGLSAEGIQAPFEPPHRAQ